MEAGLDQILADQVQNSQREHVVTVRAKAREFVDVREQIAKYISVTLEKSLHQNGHVHFITINPDPKVVKEPTVLVQCWEKLITYKCFEGFKMSMVIETEKGRRSVRRLPHAHTSEETPSSHEGRNFHRNSKGFRSLFQTFHNGS